MNNAGKYISNTILVLGFFFLVVVVFNPGYLRKIGRFLSGDAPAPAASAAASPSAQPGTPAPAAPVSVAAIAVATPVPVATPAQAASPAPPAVVKHLAPQGVYYLVERISITTDSGIVGVSPGTKVTFVRDLGNAWLMTNGKTQFEVTQDQVTNDLDVAKAVFANDQTALKAVADGIHAQEEAKRKQQQEENAAHQAEAAKIASIVKPVVQGTGYVNPLDKGAYNQHYSPYYGYYGYSYPYYRSSYYNYYGYSSGPYYDQWGNRYYMNSYGTRVYY